MRFILVLAAVSLAACEPSSNTQVVAGCMRTATHEATWTNAGAADVITTSSQGPSCAQAVVTFVARNADGDPLWAFASIYYDMAYGGSPPDGAAAVPVERVEQFLADWADVTEMRSSELPQWRADAATLTESATTFAYETPFDRNTYEQLRERDLPMICYAAAVEATECLIIDPASRAPALMAAFGP